MLETYEQSINTEEQRDVWLILLVIEQIARVRKVDWKEIAMAMSISFSGRFTASALRIKCLSLLGAV